MCDVCILALDLNKAIVTNHLLGNNQRNLKTGYLIVLGNCY